MHLAPGLLFLIAGVTGNADGNVDWSTDYGQAKKVAKEVRQPMLIVMEDPAKPEDTFDESKLTSAVEKGKLDKYLLCKVDVSTAYGKKVADAFQAKDFPYAAITDKTASYIAFRGAGQMSQNEWKKAIEKAENRVVVFKPVASAAYGDAVVSQPYIVERPAVQQAAVQHTAIQHSTVQSSAIQAIQSQPIQQPAFQSVQPTFDFYPSFSSGST